MRCGSVATSQARPRRRALWRGLAVRRRARRRPRRPRARPCRSTPTRVLDMARELAKSPFKAPKTRLPDPFANLTFEQYVGDPRASRARRSGATTTSASPSSRCTAASSSPRRSTSTSSRTAWRGGSPTTAAEFDFGKLQPPADLPRPRLFRLSHAARRRSGQGFAGRGHLPGRDLLSRHSARPDASGSPRAACRSAPAIRKARNFRCSARSGSRSRRPPPMRLVIHALLDSASVTGAFRFTLRPGEATIIDTELTLVRARRGRHIGLGAMTGDLSVRPARSRRSRRRAPRRLRGRRLADPDRQGRMDLAAGRQSRDPADFRLRRPEPARLRLSAAQPQFRRVPGRRPALGVAALAVDRADRRLGRRPDRSSSKSPPNPRTTTTSSPNGGRSSASPQAQAARSPIGSSGAGRRRRRPTLAVVRGVAHGQGRQAPALRRSSSSATCSPTRRSAAEVNANIGAHPGQIVSVAACRLQGPQEPCASCSISTLARRPIRSCGWCWKRASSRRAKHGSIDGQPDARRVRRGLRAGAPRRDAAPRRRSPMPVQSLTPFLAPRAARLGGAGARASAAG